jgi:NAD(P)-dependent dehydrogenase (short-subunit alcohol dehydrogenase family)
VSSFDWKSQVVVVTGASAGIGAALCREIARRGGSLVLAARREDKLREVAGALSAPCVVVPADVTRREDVARVLSTALERFGGVDAWVNNAGRGISRGVVDLTDDDVDTMIRDNVKSSLYGMQAVLPHFKARRRGHIINVSSMLARIPFASIRSAYSAAKHALNSLTENLRVDLAKDYPDIRVTCVMPGVVATDFGLNALGGGHDSRSLPGAQSPQEVATVLADVIATGRTGDVYTRAEGLERVLQYLRDLASGK